MKFAMGCFLAGAAALGAGCATRAVVADAQAPAGPAAGQRVYVDPLTGELRDAPATAAQARMYEGLRAPDYSRFRTEVVPGVGILLHTGDELMMTSRVHLHDDGRVEAICAPGHPHAHPQAEDRP